MPALQGRVLIIAGSDPGGGAGIQGDIKTVTCLGGYAAAAITALTAQNTLGVSGVHAVPAEFVVEQVRLVLEDIGADAIKTGMLHSAEVVSTLADILKVYDIPLVIDPVMVAKGGAPLLQPDAVQCLKSELIPLAALITPNIPEAELLSGMAIRNLEEMKIAAKAIARLGARAVLIKGGHMESDAVIHNLLLTKDGEEVFNELRIASRHTHGTGCTLASAIATGLGQGMPLRDSIQRALEYVSKAIKAAPGLGKGHGPLKHNFMIME